ncbi:OLC1v1014041C1 [Oldenlandia corymbosa var. corymbosa]|uniref:OLC1v1014041C1 n=1 Tax=Oldenlandia corymbosa var. corymbosa TaxID=529605 RepID=A0AAV1DZS5_OLDCO|nr:OLC1v1014041C1 [Oldenlandia corymbosa var. corymbosa]
MISSKMMFLILFLLRSVPWANCSPLHEEFIQCMSDNVTTHDPFSKILHLPNSQSYENLLENAQENLRLYNNSLKPLFIITPYHDSEIRATILCSKQKGLQIRIKSGGHDYEGLSYRCQTPFVIIDLVYYKAISIDLEQETAWVQSGATLGELYVDISRKSDVHGFPAGICPGVGIGGHFSGGGMGTMMRKYGLAADNVVDAVIVNADGLTLDRRGMGEDLFWAIRGGGGASFGVILSWKIKLVRVPQIVTVFNLRKQMDREGTKLVYKWQQIAPNLPPELFIRILIQLESNIVVGDFNSLFLGSTEGLISLMKQRFPELGLRPEDCTEMSWIQSAAFFAGFPNQVEALLNRSDPFKAKLKGKSDFVTEPIPESALMQIWKRHPEGELLPFMMLDPYGGNMGEIPDSETPFPHRKGNLYNILYAVAWNDDDDAGHLKWINELYMFMEPYVSKSPRRAYLNYRDLDLGINPGVNPRFSDSAVWGMKYFNANFERLAKVKSLVDPNNFFWSEQSIPPIVNDGPFFA